MEKGSERKSRNRSRGDRKRNKETEAEEELNPLHSLAENIAEESVKSALSILQVDRRLDKIETMLNDVCQYLNKIRLQETNQRPSSQRSSPVVVEHAVEDVQSVPKLPALISSPMRSFSLNSADLRTAPEASLYTDSAPTTLPLTPPPITTAPSPPPLPQPKKKKKPDDEPTLRQRNLKPPETVQDNKSVRFNLFGQLTEHLQRKRMKLDQEADEHYTKLHGGSNAKD